MELSRPNFKAVLFDLDGTLIEFKFPIKESRLAMIHFLELAGLDVKMLSEKTRTQDMMDAIYLQWKNSDKLKSLDFDELKSGLYRILDDFEYKSMRTAKPFPDGLKIMEKIKQIGISLGIVTNSGRGPVQAILEDYGFKPYMNLVITRNETSRMKPSPDGLLEAQRMLELKSNDIVYVGDSALDIEAARSAKIKCACLPTGSYRVEELRKLSPDYMLRKLGDVEKLVIPSTS